MDDHEQSTPDSGDSHGRAERRGRKRSREERSDAVPSVAESAPSELPNTDVPEDADGTPPTAQRDLDFAKKVIAHLRVAHPGVHVEWIPTVCPVLGVSLRGPRAWAIVPIDRRFGLVTGNVAIVSRRAAELLAVRASADEYAALAAWVRKASE